MTLSSMTGFARASGEADALTWVWEVKSVNGKSLDLRFRLPPGFDALEPPLRASLSQRLHRGAVSVTLTVTRTATAGTLRVNRAVLAQVLALMREIEQEIAVAPPRLDGVLSLRGVLETNEAMEDEGLREGRQAALLESCQDALGALLQVRAAEGERLGVSLKARLAEIAELVSAAEQSAAAQPQQIASRLKEMLAPLLENTPALSEERLAQEVAMLAGKADIREELDRLAAHLAAARDLLDETNPIGRRFDFLCQEFNREANTLCSKSADIGLTRIGLSLKAAIEQLREQVQNIE